ncbi:MAG: peroxiredoxin [Planctomycetota bacterium]|nr:peroxiredoxin [Planctomycetota bacterium]
MCSLRDAAAGLTEVGALVYGISLDDVASQAAFAKAQKLNFPLLSDVDGSVARKYGVLMGLMPMAKRVTFVIDPKGVLRHIDKKVNVKQHGTDLVALIRELSR